MLSVNVLIRNIMGQLGDFGSTLIIIKFATYMIRMVTLLVYTCISFIAKSENEIS